MGNNTLLAFFQNIATVITGPMGIAAIIGVCGIMFMAAGFHLVRMHTAFVTLGAGAAAFSAGYLVNTLMPGG